MTFRFTIVFLLLTQLVFGRWGWGSHRFINDAAVDHLPASMAFFQDHRDYLSEHSVDPDQSNEYPGYYHYIDIDYYPEFFTGDLPHSWQGMIDRYGQSTVESQGVVPWVIDWWMSDLSALMSAGDWDNVWQIAAELGHYVADSHQALHLTVNYNGGETGNYGIHSRYETQLMNRHLDNIILPDSTAAYWETPLDSVFAYIEDIYPIVDLVMAADDLAYASDPNHGDTYYNIMWAELGDTTVWSLNKAVMDLASIWLSAWINAGSPYPAGVGIDEVSLPDELQLYAFPNPFNGYTRISYFQRDMDPIKLSIYNVQGRLVRQIAAEGMSRGEQSILWDGLGDQGQSLETGVYLVHIQQAEQMDVTKVTLLK